MGEATYPRRLTPTFVGLELVGLLVAFLYGVPLWLVASGGVVILVVEFLHPAAKVAGGQLRIQKRFLDSGQSIPLDEIRDAKFWSEYTTIELSDGRTVSVLLAPFRRSARAAFERDLKSFLESGQWLPGPSPAA